VENATIYGSLGINKGFSQKSNWLFRKYWFIKYFGIIYFVGQLKKYTIFVALIRYRVKAFLFVAKVHKNTYITQLL
jgi:hypothetical protein